MKYFSKIFTVIIFLSITQVAAENQVGDKAINFTAITLDGKQISIQDDYIGKKPVLLVFWATWCPNCLSEIPDLIKFNDKFAESFPILAINIGMNDTIKTVKKYQKKHNLKYQFIFDEGGIISKYYQIIGTPTQIIIAANGNIMYRGVNVPKIEDIEKNWNKLTIK
ncbi:MAG: TlpA disulfide reductase family protein [Candidatus Marithrix sp.]